jgi:hypothetical protein
MKPFKFFGNKQEYIETIPSPVEVTINRAIITLRVATFVNFRDDMRYRRPDYDYVYSRHTSFTSDNIEYHCVRTLEDIRGRHFDNYILLHDAHEMNIGELGYIVANLEQRGATQKLWCNTNVLNYDETI